jgi:hypothetical protein
LLVRSCQTGSSDVFSFVPRIYEFSRLGEKQQSGKPFRLSSPGYTSPSPGERQKLITFPITAEKSHVLIFNSPPLRVSVGPWAGKRKQNAAVAGASIDMQADVL